MDALAGMLAEVRSNGALFGRSVLTPPWSVRFEEPTSLTLVTMLRGDAWITPAGLAPMRLGEGEVGIMVGPQPFTVGDTAEAPDIPGYVARGSGSCAATDGAEVGDTLRLGVRNCASDADGPTVLLNGNYHVRGRVSDRLVSALPRALVVPHQGQLCPVLELAAAEVLRVDPGQQAVLDRLLDLLLLTALREWFALPDAQPPSWYRALGDSVVGPVLRRLHDEPAEDWTVAAMAELAGVSRATFARRFNELLGEPPMAYLTGWRLALAADLLERSDATVDAIARQVGYVSAFSLSVAFKRVYGSRPSDHRRLALSA